jgi:hypothetical protein
VPTQQHGLPTFSQSKPLGQAPWNAVTVTITWSRLWLDIPERSWHGSWRKFKTLACWCYTGALRFGYFYGGDGEAITRFDVRNLAGFVRDRSALITNWLLPLPSAKLELRQEYPIVEEHKALLPILL